MREGNRTWTTSFCGVLLLLGSACGTNGNLTTPPDDGRDGAVVLGEAGVKKGETGGADSDVSVVADAAAQPDLGRTPDLIPASDAGGKDGARPDAAQGSEGGPNNDARDAELVLYGLTAGASCYKITALAPGSKDGCDLGVASMVGFALPGIYDLSTGVFTLGAGGSLGSGAITYNLGTLVRPKGTLTDPTVAQCTWNQSDTTALTMTDTNAFTISVLESQDSIAPACGTPFATCTSTWTWTMAIDGSKKAPGCL